MDEVKVPARMRAEANCKEGPKAEGRDWRV